jgi:predicted 3-demethylubiquinone-9 3-methyltransferase (glyoxalase superfamily)
MQKITTFLTFPERAEEAAKFYVSIFKPSKIVKTTRYGESGPGAKGRVMTVQFKLAGQDFIALNGGDSNMFAFSMGVSLSVDCKTQKEIDTYTRKLLAGGGEQLACGWVRDKFGMYWQITPTILPKMIGDKNAARADRAMNAMMQMTKLDIAALKKAYAGK